MKREISIGKDKFSYVNNGKYIRITSYTHEDGTIKFTDEKDGKKYFHIHIPETIEGVPVLVIDPLWLDVDYIHNYRHNGLDVIKFHIPENTAFFGLRTVGTGMNSVFIPNFTEEYFPRREQLLRRDEGAYHFFAEKMNNTACGIYAIVRDNYIKKDWVWENNSRKSAQEEKLMIPSHINGCSVLEIYADSTRALPEEVKEIHIEEGIEVIGENCFSGLPYVSHVYLPKSIKRIGNGAFGYYEESRYVKNVPVLHVHFHDSMPQIGENAFIRKADREEYEEYADWGNMYAGTTHLNFEVVYQKNE